MTESAGIEAEIAESARAAWPDLAAEASAFAREMSERAGREEDPIRWLGEVHMGDLFLAWCCARGSVPAFAALDRVLVRDVPHFVARTDASVAFADEVIQLVRTELLLVEGEKAPGIARYSGRGALGGWIRVIAVRIAHRLKRARGPRAELAAAASPDRADGDPELEILKAHCRQEFAAAVESVLGSLADRERRVLRLHYMEGRSINDIAELFGVHRLTVSRWLKAMRSDILDRTRQLLIDRHRLPAAEADSLMELVQSRFDLSLSKVLETRR